MNKKIRKAISLTLIFLFSLNQSTPFSQARAAFPLEVQIPDSGFALSLPPELGTIDFIHSGLGPAIVHIQTVHGNYEAQKKIQAILHYLKDTYGFKLLLLEGSASKLEPKLLQFFPDEPAVTMEIAEELSKDALVKGDELFLLEASEAQGRGIEKVEPYRRAREAFKAVLLEKEKTGRLVREMNLQIERLAGVYLNKRLRDFLRHLERFEAAGPRRAASHSLGDWLNFLKTEAKEVLDLDPASPLNQLDWPMLLRIYKLKELESKLDLDAFSMEWKRFLRAIRRIPKEIRRDVKALLASPLSQNQLPDPQTSLLFERLVESLPRNFRYDAYPNVKFFIARLILRSELKSDQLFKEANLLTDKISRKLARVEEEKKLLELFKDYRLLQRLFALELTPEDYEKILRRQRPEEMRPSHIANRFLELNRANRVRSLTFAHLDELDLLFDKAIDFYRSVKERDHWMFQNIEQRMKETGQSKAVVITGGFHSEPFKDYFQAEGYGYVLVTPKFTAPENRDAYLESVLQNSESSLRGSTMETTRLMERPEIRAAMGSDLNWENARIQSAYLRVLKQAEKLAREKSPVHSLSRSKARWKKWPAVSSQPPVGINSQSSRAETASKSKLYLGGSFPVGMTGLVLPPDNQPNTQNKGKDAAQQEVQTAHRFSSWFNWVAITYVLMNRISPSAKGSILNIPAPTNWPMINDAARMLPRLYSADANPFRWLWSKITFALASLTHTFSSVKRSKMRKRDLRQEMQVKGKEEAKAAGTRTAGGRKQETRSKKEAFRKSSISPNSKLKTQNSKLFFLLSPSSRSELRVNQDELQKRLDHLKEALQAAEAFLKIAPSKPMQKTVANTQEKIAQLETQIREMPDTPPASSSPLKEELLLLEKEIEELKSQMREAGGMSGLDEWEEIPEIHWTGGINFAPDDSVGAQLAENMMNSDKGHGRSWIDGHFAFKQKDGTLGFVSYGRDGKVIPQEIDLQNNEAKFAEPESLAYQLAENMKNSAKGHGGLGIYGHIIFKQKDGTLGFISYGAGGQIVPQVIDLQKGEAKFAQPESPAYQLAKNMKDSTKGHGGSWIYGHFIFKQKDGTLGFVSYGTDGKVIPQVIDLQNKKAKFAQPKSLAYQLAKNMKDSAKGHGGLVGIYGHFIFKQENEKLGFVSYGGGSKVIPQVIDLQNNKAKFAQPESPAYQLAKNMKDSAKGHGGSGIYGHIIFKQKNETLGFISYGGSSAIPQVIDFQNNEAKFAEPESPAYQLAKNMKDSAKGHGGLGIYGHIIFKQKDGTLGFISYGEGGKAVPQVIEGSFIHGGEIRLLEETAAPVSGADPSARERLQTLEFRRDRLQEELFKSDRRSELRKEVRSELRVHSAPFPNFKEGIDRYYAAKLAMWNALNRDDADGFRAALREFYETAESLKNILNQTQDKTAVAQAASKIGQALSSPGSDFPGFLFGHKKGDDALREIGILGGARDADDFYKDLRRQIIGELARDLYPNADDESLRLKIETALDTDILTTSIRDLMPIRSFRGEIGVWKEKARAGLARLPEIISSWGHYDTHSKKVHVNPNPEPKTAVSAASEKDRELILRSTIAHEARHYFLDDIPGRGRILKAPAHWEFLTYAPDVIERVKHMPPGAKLSDYADEFGDAALEPLFERGRQYAREGGTGFEIKEGVAGVAGSGLFFDGLHVQAVLAYKDAGLSAAAFLNDYAGQRAVAIVLGGFMHEKMQTNPNFGSLAYLKEMFDALDVRQGLPTEEERRRMESVFNEVSDYVNSLTGAQIRMQPVTGGFWQLHLSSGAASGILQYLPSDFRPRPEDGDFDSRSNAMRERVLGHALLAIGRKKYAREPQETMIPETLRGHTAFSLLWNVFDLPRAIQLMLSEIGFRDGMKEAQKGAPLWFHRVFRDRYSPEIPLAYSRARLGALPLHLQFLDSLLYLFTNAKPPEAASDPRLENREVIEALTDAWGDFDPVSSQNWGAGKLLFDSGRLNLKDFSEILAGKIWSPYERLFQKALEQEREKMEAVNKVKEDTEGARKIRKEFEKTAQQWLDAQQNQFGPHMQSGHASGGSQQGGMSGMPGLSGGGTAGSQQPGGSPTQGAAGSSGFDGLMQALGPEADQPGVPSGQPGQGSQGHAGDKNPFRPFQQSPQIGPKEQPQPDPFQGGGDAAASTDSGTAGTGAMQEMFTGLESQLDQLSEKIKNLQAQLDSVGKNLQGVQSQASHMGGEAGQAPAGPSKDAAIPGLESGAGGLQAGVEGVGQGTKQIVQDAKAAHEQSKSAAAENPWSLDGLHAQDQSTQAVEDAKGLEAKAAQLKNLADQITKQVNDLVKNLQNPDPQAVSTVQNQAASLQQTLQALKNLAAGMQASAGGMGNTLTELEKSIAGLKQSVEALEAAQGAESGKAGSGQPQGGGAEGGESAEPAKPSGPEAGALQSGSLEGSGARFEIPGQGKGLSGLTGIESVPTPAAAAEKAKIQAFRPDMKQFNVYLDEEAEAKNFGFTVKEYREYLDWKKEEVLDLKGKRVTVKTLIDRTKEFLDALLIPVRKEKEIGPFQQGEDFGDEYLVEALMGEPAMVDTVKKLPVPVTLSMIFDRSGSMGWSKDGGEPIKLAKLIAFVFLEALFAHNEERETRGYRDQPARFEIGLFEIIPKLNVSHATSAKTDPQKRSSKKIIYDLVKALEAGGGTKFSDALGIFTERLLKTDDPVYGSPKAIRLLAAVTDEQVSETQKATVEGIMEKAEKDGVKVLLVPVGGAAERARSVRIHGKERVIEANPLSVLPQALAARLVLEVRDKHPEIPISYDLLQLSGRSEMRASQNGRPLERIPTGTVDENGEPRHFQHFFIQKRDGREFLVWFDDTDPDRMLSWERGPGGPDVPRMEFALTLSDELFIKEILMSLYRKDTVFTSVSPNRQWMIRKPALDELELDRFDIRRGRWSRAARSSYETLAGVRESGGIYSNGQVWWKADPAAHAIEISTDGKTYSKVEHFSFNQYRLSGADFQVLDGGSLVYLNPADGTAVFLEKEGGVWKQGSAMRIEDDSAPQKWFQHVLEVTGETGLGKDVAMLAAARLMNEQAFVIGGHVQMKEGELDWWRAIGVEQAGVSSQLPAAFTLAQEHGGWVLLREAHKIPDDLWAVLKTKISSREHKAFEKGPDGETVEWTRPDHPRTRILASSNLARKNIQGAANRDQAVQRRKEALLKVWEYPEDEVLTQLEYARTLARRLGTYHSNFDQEMGPIVERLVFTAVSERLAFMGYSDTQARRLASSRSSWEKLKDWDFEPAHNAGEQLNRAPSPRVIRNILAHFVRYPKDLKHRPWSVIHDLFNFEAERDRENTYRRVPTDFERAGFGDERPGEAPVLERNSFKVIKESNGAYSLEVSVIENPGEERWDKVIAPLHPQSAMARNPDAISKKLLDWVNIPENARLVYQTLQDYSLGMDTMLVGEQETGKSVLITELQLLAGPSPRQYVDMRPTTKPKDLTYQIHVGEQGKPGVFGFKKKPVALAMELDVPVHLDEANHAESVAVLNDVLDSRTLTDPLGNREKVSRGFVVWMTVNPPGEGFLVNDFSAEFLERVKIRKANPLPPSQLRAFVEPFMYQNGLSVHSRFVGEEIPDGPNRGKWTGLIGLASKIRELRGADRSFLPRAPGPGTVAGWVSETLDYYEHRLGDRNIRLKQALRDAGDTVPAEGPAQIVKNYFSGLFNRICG